MAYLWLQQLLNLLLPELEHLPVGPQGETQARSWFERLLARFAERGLITPAQQKNRVVDARNAIRTRFGDDHPALAYVGFDEQTWQAINLPTHDRTEARNENQRLLREPVKIVARAAKLLESARFEDLAVGLGLTVGRRISELLDGHAKLEPATAWSVLFTGQRKHRGDREDFSFEVPTLAPAEKVLGAWGRLLVMLGDQALTPQEINHRYGHQVNQAADRHFRGLVPPRLPAAKKGKEGGVDDPHGRERKGDALYLHLFRAVYATIAVHWFCPPRVNRLVFKAEIQGHRQILEAPTPTMRRSYAASRHYDDYQIADPSGKNIDGRQGIKLGKLPGVQVLKAFQAPTKGQPKPKPGPMMPPPQAVDPLPPSILPPSLLPTDMDPATPPAATHDTPMTIPESPATAVAASTLPAPDADGDAPKAAPEKKPRPVTYRIYPVDRPRLDAFRTDPKQSQADNLQGVIDLLENASAAIRGQDQMQAQLEEALARTEQIAAKRDQARQEAQAERGQREAREEELRQLQQTLAQERARAAAAPPMAASTPVGQAVLARELLALATEAGCPSVLQGRLIALATQALGSQQRPEKRQDASAPPPSIAKGTGRPRKAHRPAADPARFGPLFAGAATQPVTDAGGQEAPHESQEDKTGAEPDQPTEAAAPVHEEAADPSAGTPAGDAQEPPGTSESSAARSNRPWPVQRRGRAAAKLSQALAAVLAHNQTQSAREKKWAVTESALARLTGCFRPAVRAFFAERAEEIEAHNLQHHLSGGHNAAKGKKGETIEGEIAWRERETEAPILSGGAHKDQGAGDEESLETKVGETEEG